jgi:hypothetical protein
MTRKTTAKPRRRSFTPDLEPADEAFTEAVHYLQFGWKDVNAEWGGVGTRYERSCFSNLMRVTRGLPRRDLTE